MAMMAKRPQHAREFSEPMQFGSMSREHQTAAKAIVGDFTATFGERANKQADALDRQAAQPGVKDSNAKLYGGKAKRLRRAAAVSDDKPVSIGQAADRRIAAMTTAATTARMQGSGPTAEHPHHTNPEGIGGEGWYFHAHGDVKAHAPNTPSDVAMTASSMMSPGTDPQTERRALQALDQAHSGGKVHMHPELVAHLASKGVSVPAEMHDTTVAFHELPGHVVGQLAQVDSQKVAAKHSNVNFKAMGAVSATTNVAKAHDLMRGATRIEDAQSPTDAPKTWSYTNAQKLAVPGTPEHGEYMARAQHVGAVLRGEQNGRQDMLDLWGKRDSNEGILSNTQHTAEDNWMRGVSVGLKDKGLLKAGGDVQPGVKQHPTAGSAAPAGVGGEAVYHAWNNAATTAAAKKLERQHGLGFTVPSVLVQETSWTGARREAGQNGGKGDAEFNAQERGRREDEVQAHRDAKMGPQFQGLKGKQLGLF
jgi:hypothetical protein